ncbi:MAG: hypothetical protein H0W12_06275, partial [Chitinophagaceae bacterium]|nr:hypothetical protein [Chitinophagaceae bacterium]
MKNCSMTATSSKSVSRYTVHHIRFQNKKVFFSFLNLRSNFSFLKQWVLTFAVVFFFLHGSAQITQNKFSDKALNPSPKNSNVNLITVQKPVTEYSTDTTGKLFSAAACPVITIAIISQTNNICFGGNSGSIKVNATGGANPITYSISPAGGTQSPSGTFNNLTAQAYTITATDANGCNATLAVNIGQPRVIAINTLTSNSPLCLGNTLLLSASSTGGTGTLVYNWTGPNAFISNQQNPSIANVTAAAAGTYTLKVKDQNNCTTSSTITVAITTPATAFIDYPGAPFCNNQASANVTLTGTGTYNNGTYSALPGLSINSLTGAIDFTASTPGTYLISYTIPAAGSCSPVIATTFVSFGTAPVITINTTLDTSTCKNNNLTLIALASGSPLPLVQWQVSTNNGATWNNIPGATNPNYTIVNISPSQNGDMYRAIFSNACGSVITNETLIHVGSPLHVASDPANQTSCANFGTVTFTSSGNGGNGLVVMSWQYSHDGITWFDIPGTTTTSLIGNYSTSYTFSFPNIYLPGDQFRAKFSNARCFGSYSEAAVLNINPTPVLSPIPDQIICNGASTLPVNFTGTNITSFSWTNDNTSIGLAANGTGNIGSFIAINNGTVDAIATIIATPVYTGGNPVLSCVGAPITFTITVKPIPVVTTLNACIGGGTVVFTETGSISGTWSVNGGGIIDAITGSFTPSTPGCFIATYTTSSGNCSDSKSFVVFPSAPVITAPVNTCGTAFTLPVVAAIPGFTVEYSINGSPFSSSPSLPTIPGCYSIIVRYVLTVSCGASPANTSGTASCGTSNPVSVVIFPSAPVIIASANTCNTAFILPAIISYPGFTIKYSLDGGLFSSTPVIPSTPGCHTIQAQYELTAACGGSMAGTLAPAACGSGNVVSVVIFPAPPFLATPVNTCASAFSLPAVIAIPGFAVEYNIDGTGFSASPIIPATPGCHTIQARYVLNATCGLVISNTAGSGACATSNKASVVIFPAAPAIMPLVNTCDAQLNIVTPVTIVPGFTAEYAVQAPGGILSSYNSILSQVNNLFTNSPGCWTIKARYKLSSSCGSTPADAISPNILCQETSINAIVFPSALSAPIVSPGCGAFIVTPPANVNGFIIQYSFDNGVTWGPNIPPTADNCAGYKIKTRYVTAATCGSTLAGSSNLTAPCNESPAVTRIVDNTAPVWTTVAGSLNVSVQCNDVPGLAAAQAMSPVATDNCSVVSYIKTPGSFMGNACGGKYINSWVAMDVCNNTSTVITQVITINPAALPVMTAPASITITCGTIPVPGTLTYSNALSGTCLINGTSNPSTFSATPGSCGGTIIETWTATDACGRALAPVTRTIIVTPASLPTMIAPSAITISCGAIPVSSKITFTNGLSGSCLISGNSNVSTFSATPGPCGGTITETWTATDPCGRVLAPVTRIINVTPATLPTMTAPANKILACGAIPASTTLIFTNALNGNCLINGTSNPSTFSAAPGPCGGTITETWTATDVCGRALAPVSRTITVTPAPLPTMIATTAITLACGAIPTSSKILFSNGLNGSCLINGTSNQSTFSATPGACGGTITETWTATDACGRGLVPVKRIITVTAATLPKITAPVPITISCGTIPVPGTLNYTNGLNGSCLINGTSNLSTLSASPGACGGTIAETWTATDACGRTLVPVSRTITVTPATLPTMIAPSAITVQCGATPAASHLTFTNGLSGSCLINGNSNLSTFSALPAACGGTITETWTATDACGRALAPVTRTITVTPAMLPTMIAPSVITISCSTIPAATKLNFTNGLSGSCLINGNSNLSTFSATPGPCGGTITETWTATDVCGRVLTPVSRTITVTPAPLPKMIAPAAITISCGAIPTSGTILFSNGLIGSCLINGTSNQSTFSATPGACGGTITETWTATDACGRGLVPVTRIIT